MTRTLLLTIALLLGTVLQAQTELYALYADREGVSVAAVTNFALDSTSRIDVTSISAITDSGWAWMKTEFQIAELAPGQEATLTHGSDVVLFARRNRHRPGQPAPLIGEQIDEPNSCYLGISYLDRAVYIFCSDSPAQSEAIATMLVKKMMATRQ